MTAIYKSDEGRHLVCERYAEILARWPVPNERRGDSRCWPWADPGLTLG
jgi:hypothetical protein